MKLICKHLAFILLLFYSTNSSAQSVLWIVEGNGLEKPSYIFGSVHEMCQHNFKWDIKIERAMKITKRVCFEIDINNIFELFRQKRIEKMPDGYSLKDFYSEEDYELVSTYFKEKFKINVEKKDNISPLFLMMNAAYKGQKEICKKRISYDYEILRLYKEKYTLPVNVNKVDGLETAEERDHILKKISYQRQADIILHVIRQESIEKTSSALEYAQMISSYYRMDIDEIRESSSTDPEIRDFENNIIDARNELWVKKMPKMMENNPTFFVVGAAHLGGDFGLINLLKDEGYTVRPLKMTWDKKL
ncbi:TraB/GumN family protein [Arcicella lustrica]|uniref:TraB/GumN family protein n=1 Tax=Arcicella lustrica TaxID=2984196 RepID=A0ABU5SIK5_9BACT|nr:TraB/GumN family protein [Arcicella sp. DC25W]MEA5426864.1 TraB/GumN family protein [Arcicella sp. DC25W]